MRVFITGLIFLNGCQEAEKRAYAPDGRDEGHFASLWIEASQVEESATNWWPLSRETRTVEGVDVIEFRIPEPVNIEFPDDGNAVTCFDLDELLPKLKKKKPDESEEDFEVDPATAETIAEVTIGGGEIRPWRFKNMGLVEWTIEHPSGPQIIAVLKGDASESRTITLNAPAEAEIVFSNTHNLFEIDKKTKKDALAGSHVALFIKLNPEPNVTVVSKKLPGSVGQLKSDNPILNVMRKSAHTEGETPPCCKTLPIHNA